MNRKEFVSSLIFVGTAFSTVNGGGVSVEKRNRRKFIIPEYLKFGDTIGITSPAGYIDIEEIQPAIRLIEGWGFKVVIGSAIGKRDFTYGGSDDDRYTDLQSMLDNANIKAILCARGGYGLVRIVDRLNFKRFNNKPKWIIGFSDVTVLHNHIDSNYGVATLHSKMCNSFPSDFMNADQVQKDTILSIKAALTGERYHYISPPALLNRFGRAHGLLVGGNLSILETLGGTSSDLDTRGKVLFLEDIGEYPYRIDRMLWNLKRSGKLSGLAGLIVGGFNMKVDEPGEEFGKSIYEMVWEKISEYNYPVCFDFPVGHQKNNFALKCGTMHVLDVGKEGGVLKSGE